MAYGYIAVMQHKPKRALKERTINFRMTEEEVDRLDGIAVRDDRSRAQVLRRFVIDGMNLCDPPKIAVHGN